MKLPFTKKQKGFSFVEIIVVISIIIVIVIIVFGASFVRRDQTEFKNAYEAVEAMLQRARVLALSGESYPDYSDYDKDGIYEEDFILPYGYIVNFKTEDKIIAEKGNNVAMAADPGVERFVTISLYADLYSSAIGQLDLENDQLIETRELPSSVEMSLIAERQTGGEEVDIPDDDFSVIYKTGDAKFSIVDFPDTSIELTFLQRNTQEEVVRSKNLFMHYSFGIPEVVDTPYLNPGESPESGDEEESPIDEPPPDVVPECGNGVLEEPEACDDGNLIDGDCCSSTCLIEDIYECR